MNKIEELHDDDHWRNQRTRESMSVLSDGDIVECMKSGRLAIEGFDEQNLTPNGYDVTIEEIFYDDRLIKNEDVDIAPLKWFAVSTKEYFRMGEGLTAQLWLRTSWIRKGIVGSFGKVDAGFEGTLTLSAFNASGKSVHVSIGDRFAQIVFETLSSRPQKSYKGRSGRYQNQRGITLEPPGRKRSGP